MHRWVGLKSVACVPHSLPHRFIQSSIVFGAAVEDWLVNRAYVQIEWKLVEATTLKYRGEQQQQQQSRHINKLSITTMADQCIAMEEEKKKNNNNNGEEKCEEEEQEEKAEEEEEKNGKKNNNKNHGEKLLLLLKDSIFLCARWT